MVLPSFFFSFILEFLKFPEQKSEMNSRSSDADSHFCFVVNVNSFSCLNVDILNFIHFFFVYLISCLFSSIQRI